MKKTLFLLSTLMLIAPILCMPVSSSADYLDNWTLRYDAGPCLRGITHGNGKFVAVGDGGLILSSPDALTWTQRTSGTTENLNTVIYAKNTFVIVGNHGTILISSDGETWVARTPYSGTTGNLYTIAYGNGKFVAVVGSPHYCPNTVLTSPDAYTWTVVNPGPFLCHPHSIGFFNDLFVAVGMYGEIFRSPDGLLWEQATSGISDTLYSVSYGNEIFVAVGSYGAVVTSHDGLEWITRNSGTSNTLYGLAFANGTFVAVGDNDSIMTSYDGIAWSRRYGSIEAGYLSIVHGQSTFLAVGFTYGYPYRGQIIQSDPVPPDAPSSLTAKATFSSRITLSWLDNSTDETAFGIERKEGGCGSTDEWSGVKTLGRNAKIFTDTRLSPNSRYAYRLRAYNGSVVSEYSNCASTKTALSGTPVAPSNLKATSMAASRINLTWNDIANNEDTFKIYRKVGAGPWKLLATRPENAKVFADAKAAGNVNTNAYSYYIQACNESGCSPTTNSATVPCRPVNLSASRIFSTQINLKWTDISSNEKGFQVYRKLGPCSSTNPWVLMGTTKPNATVYIDKGLSSGTTYSYRLNAYNKSSAGPYAYGYSYYSNCLSVTTP